jgi:hypothetical protein
MIEENNDENTDDYFDSRPRTQSTSLLLPPDSVMIRPGSPRQDRSPSPSSSPLFTGNSPKTNLSSFLKISSPNPKTNNSPPLEERFLMTVIRSPSSNSQRIQSNEPSGATITNEELSNNNKFFKNKMTAALNHMKYRKFQYTLIL